MQWRGKMIGGSIGSFFGPWGALAGAAVGHAFVDRKQAAAAEKEALSLLAVTAGSLYEVAGVDGRYTPAEDKTIRAILAELNERLGSRLSAHELTYLIDDSSRIDRSLARLAARARTQPDLRMAATAWLWRTAVCDGDPTPPETSCVHAFIGQTGLPPEEAERAAILYVRPRLHADERERQQACGVLGVAYHADQSQIKAAYRTLSQTYHPDKHAGLDPAIRALTAEKFAQIKTAYDTLCGTSCRIQGWVVKPVGANRLMPATAGAAVHCFICGRKHELPAEAQIGAARCASCQTLLALDPGLAEQLI